MDEILWIQCQGWLLSMWVIYCLAESIFNDNLLSKDKWIIIPLNDRFSLQINLSYNAQNLNKCRFLFIFYQSLLTIYSPKLFLRTYMQFHYVSGTCSPIGKFDSHQIWKRVFQNHTEINIIFFLDTYSLKSFYIFRRNLVLYTPVYTSIR